MGSETGVTCTEHEWYLNQQRIKHEAQLAAALARAEAAEKERDELREVVERLPKDATNELIIYGDTKWWLEPGEAGDDGLVQVVCWEASPLPDDSHYRLDHGHTHRVAIKGRGANAMNGELFNTREAALATREGGEMDTVFCDCGKSCETHCSDGMYMCDECATKEDALNPAREGGE